MPDIAPEVTQRGISSNGVPYALLDTWCSRPDTPEEKTARDTKILEIYTRSQEKKLLKHLAHEAETVTAEGRRNSNGIWQAVEKA